MNNQEDMGSEQLEREMSACSVFSELQLEGKLCDVIIQVKNVTFSAHKIILCGCSSYFRTLFTSGWSESGKQNYTITGVSPEIMQLIIQYAYTRYVNVTHGNVEELLAAADMLAVLGVVKKCCCFLRHQLCPRNCVGIWRYAGWYSCEDLKLRAHRFILQQFERLTVESEEFLTLTLHELSDIIQRDELNAKQEDLVFQAIIRWIQHQPQKRIVHISTLLPMVRMGLMTPDYFMNNVKNNALVRESEECKPIIISALKAMYDLNMNGLSTTNYRNPLTRPRLPQSVLLAIGGWSGGSPTNGIEAYDARADRWVNVTQEEESPRAYHGAAFLSGLVYCVGGFNSVDYFNSVRKFNPISRTWHEVAPMHSRRCYVSVCVLNGCIYAMGGFDGHVRLNTAERYEPETNQWTIIAPMHEQRSDASATTLHGKVYICGGFNGNECLFTAECYMPETNQWSLIEPMRSRRSGVGVIAYGDQLYSVGGFDGANRLSSAEVYNPLTNTWRNIPNMFNPRSNFGIEVLDELIFVIGGFNGFSTTFCVECYDERTDQWYDAHDMAIFRSALSCCVVSGLPNMVEYAAPRDVPDNEPHSRQPQTHPVSSRDDIVL
ncbi:kelch-like protein 10 [Trichomycterus rosablanca]|uniref:kelch-like protein 10 n=1 Tax=Trichomycterus rosablanca TaxID=2290929 RepID=UPI002F35A7DF